MIICIPAYNPLAVCAKCWAAGTPHNDSGIARPPYLRVPYCEHHEVAGDRIQCPVLADDLFVVDGRTMVVKAARIEPASFLGNEVADGHAWAWVIEAEPDEENE